MINAIWAPATSKKKTLINPLQRKHSFSNERIQPLNILTFEFIIPSISCTHWSPCCWTDSWKVLKDTVIPKQSKIEKHIEMKTDSCTLAGTNGQISMMSVCRMEPPSEGNDLIDQYCGWGWVGSQGAWSSGTVVFSTSCMLSWERRRYHHHARSKEMEMQWFTGGRTVQLGFFSFPEYAFNIVYLTTDRILPGPALVTFVRNSGSLGWGIKQQTYQWKDKTAVRALWIIWGTLGSLSEMHVSHSTEPTDSKSPH